MIEASSVTDSKPNGQFGPDPTGAQASAEAALDVNRKNDALQLATADLDIVSAAAALKLSLQTAQAKADKAKADAKAATSAKQKAMPPLSAKLADDNDTLALEKRKQDDAAKVVSAKKRELDSKVAEYDAATKAQLAAKVEVDAAQKRYSDAQAAKADADAAATQADKDAVAAQQAFDAANADLQAAQALELTLVDQANAQFVVDKTQAESTEAAARATAAKKKYEILKAAKERDD